MRFLVLSMCVALTGAVDAQRPSTATFDAASVKPVKDGRPAIPLVALQAGGRFYAPRATLTELVRVAYGVETDQVVGGPSWSARDAFEIVAKTTATASLDDARAMLRMLLTERFALAVHTETRDLPAYLLETSGKPGPGLRLATPGCTPMKVPAGIPPPPPPPPAGQAPLHVLDAPPIGSPRCAGLFLNGWVSVRGGSLGWFAYQSGLRSVNRRVIDHTGLTGHFDIDLVYTPDEGPAILNGSAITGDAPALSTAMHEQLGLKLAWTKASLPVVVIDRAERPTDN